MRIRLLGLLLIVAAVVPTVALARSDRSAGTLAVDAAGSVTDMFPKFYNQPQYKSAVSDQLAFQTQQGAPADVFAAASPKYPEQLYKQGLVQKPIPFTTNTLVLIFPKSN